MDILSHGLWATAGVKWANNLNACRQAGPLWSRNISLRWTFFWGMFPDLFAFTIPFIWMIWNVLIGTIPIVNWPAPERVEPVGHDGWPALQLAALLYQYSHSLVIFGLIAALIFIMVRQKGRRLPLEIFGWPLHIFMDIPTHSYRFFPTPVFWPISEWKFDGFSWANLVFMVANYGLLILVFFLLSMRSKQHL